MKHHLVPLLALLSLSVVPPAVQQGPPSPPPEPLFPSACRMAYGYWIVECYNHGCTDSCEEYYDPVSRTSICQCTEAGPYPDCCKLVVHWSEVKYVNPPWLFTTTGDCEAAGCTQYPNKVCTVVSSNMGNTKFADCTNP